MAETLAEETKTQKDIYGITPEMRAEYRKKLEQLIREQGVKAAKTEEDLYRYSESGQTQEEIQAEIDDFLRLREEWREEDRRLSKERENESFD